MTDQTQTPQPPPWEEVPKYARYMAMDGDGRWWWYEKEPVEMQNDHMWTLPPNKGRSGKAEKYYPNWSSTLMKRPTKKKSDV